jgi:hypothetical protein
MDKYVMKLRRLEEKMINFSLITKNLELGLKKIAFLKTDIYNLIFGGANSIINAKSS